MGGSKKSKAAAQRAQRRLMPMPGLMVAALFVAAVLAGGGYLAWNLVGHDVLTSSQYAVRLENIEITPPPKWIHSDVRGDVYRVAASDGSLSVLDDHLVKRFADSFALHPWVAKVRSVTKLPGARLRVELDYRQPVCMVEVPTGSGVLPVDASGVWLPSSDFSPVEASRYPRLVGIKTMPIGPVGTPWGDARVSGGAEVAAALLPLWISMKLERIEPSETAESVDAFMYSVYTHGRTRIVWGRAPGATSPDPVSAADKVSRLREIVAEQGSPDGHQGPQQIDLRDPRGVQISPLPRAPR